MGIQIHPLVVGPRHLTSHESAFSAISQERPDGLIVATSALTLRPGRRAWVIEFTAKRQLPIYSRTRFVKAGGIMSHEASSTDRHRRVATYVAKILKGAKPGDLPIEHPTKFDLVINLKTAKKLGVTIPPQFPARADKVIK